MTRPALIVVSLVILGGFGCASPDCPAGTVLAASDRCLSVDEVMMEDFGDAGVVLPDGAPDAGDPAALDAGPAPCVPTGEADLPDALHADTNCDGIDGTTSGSIFVADVGDDGNHGMTPEMPVRTIAHAIDLATTVGRSAVLVAAGTYEEQITLVAGISVHGGYDAADGFARTASERTVVTLEGTVLVAEDVEDETFVSELDLVARDAAPGESSIAVRLVRASGVVLERVAVTAGRGGEGASGRSAPTPTGMGSSGSIGLDARLLGTTCSMPVGTFRPEGGSGAPTATGCVGCGTGGSGGRGEYLLGTVVMSASSGASGEEGELAACTSGAPMGGAGGAPGTSIVRTGARGMDGATGALGAAGAPGSAFGAIDATGYTRATGGRGGKGVSGEGGGGGGGGRGCVESTTCVASGGGGGGGGSGGCGGEGGYGGEGGGASIAVLAIETAVRIVGGSLATSDGGLGGGGTSGAMGAAGGAGANGGPGITYGACMTGAGGRGGDGGRGGAGGAGGGGGGGPSVAIVLDLTSTITTGSDYTVSLGEGGAGGAGGTRGEPGLAAETHTAVVH